MKHIKKFNENSDHLFRETKPNTEKTLQDSMSEFYSEYDDDYIDGNAHGLIIRLIKHLQDDNLLVKGEWDIN